MEDAIVFLTRKLFISESFSIASQVTFACALETAKQFRETKTWISNIQIVQTKLLKGL